MQTCSNRADSSLISFNPLFSDTLGKQDRFISSLSVNDVPAPWIIVLHKVMPQIQCSVSWASWRKWSAVSAHSLWGAKSLQIIRCRYCALSGPDSAFLRFEANIRCPLGVCRLLYEQTTQNTNHMEFGLLQGSCVMICSTNTSHEMNKPQNKDLYAMTECYSLLIESIWCHFNFLCMGAAYKHVRVRNVNGNCYCYWRATVEQLELRKHPMQFWTSWGQFGEGP